MSATGCQHPDGSDTSVLVVGRATWSDHVVQTSLALARAQLRHGWRSLAGIVVLVTPIGGLVLAGLAGAERTRTAVDRMIEKNEVSDVAVNPDKGDGSALNFDKVAALPMVAELSRVHGVGAFAEGPFTADNLRSGPFTLATDGRLLVDFDRPVLEAGRVPDPNFTDEVYVDRTYADLKGPHVGDTIRWTVFVPDVLQAAQTAANKDPNAGLAMLDAPGAGQLVQATIVGNGLDGIVVDKGYEPVQVWIGPALYEKLGEPSAGLGGAEVRLKDPGRLDEFKAAVNSMVRLTVAVALGIVIAVVLATALSSLTPVGLARWAEPDPGVRFAASILLGGVGVLVVLFVAVGMLPAWTRGRRRSGRDGARPRRSRRPGTDSPWSAAPSGRGVAQ